VKWVKNSRRIPILTFIILASNNLMRLWRMLNDLTGSAHWKMRPLNRKYPPPVLLQLNGQPIERVSSYILLGLLCHRHFNMEWTCVAIVLQGGAASPLPSIAKACLNVIRRPHVLLPVSSKTSHRVVGVQCASRDDKLYGVYRWWFILISLGLFM